MKYLVILLTFFTLACSDDSDEKPVPAKETKPAPASENAKEEAQPAPAEKKAKPTKPAIDCTPVDPSEFLALVDGTWQVYRPGMVTPDCWSDNYSGEITRSFLAFDRYANTFEEFSTVYGKFPYGVGECKQGSLGSGTRQNDPRQIAVEICQTPELVKVYGPNHYFMKETFGFYRVVGTTQDTSGRTVLLFGGTISNVPLLPDSPLKKYINHNDFNSVEF